MVLAVVAARELFSPDATATLARRGGGLVFWVANWGFVAHGPTTSQGAAPSPLQHTWSLGVEEQYYLIWPLLLIACRRIVLGSE